MTKPSDFFIGIQDFFAILLPGTAAAYFILEEAAARGMFSTLDGSRAVVAFAFASYVLGHLVFLIGSYLDPIYDRWRRRTKTWEDDGAYRAAAALHKAEAPSLRGASFSTFKWCRAYVALRAPDARTELDYLEATSKFFRSLVVLLVLGSATMIVSKIPVPANTYLLAALGAGLSWLCFLRFCDQRWKLTELAYAYAVLVSQSRQQHNGRPRTNDEPVDDR